MSSDSSHIKRKLESESAEDSELKKIKGDDLHIQAKVEDLELENKASEEALKLLVDAESKSEFPQSIDNTSNVNKDTKAQLDGEEISNPSPKITKKTDEISGENNTVEEVVDKTKNEDKTSNQPKEAPKATFGGTLFKINPQKSSSTEFGKSFSESSNNSTPIPVSKENENNEPTTDKINTDNNITTNNNKDNDDKKSNEKKTTSHVFGSASSFGNALQMSKNKPSIFDSNTSSSSESTKSSTFGSTFGSGFGSNSAFGNAFQNSLKKKSFLDKDSNNDATSTDKTTKESETSSPSTVPAEKLESRESSQTPQQYKQIDLAPVEEIKTGEENEHSLFSVTAKIFELNLTKISEGWKEKGLGPLHLNESIEDKNQVRLVMRSQGLLRVVLNMKIAKNTNLIKGLEASLSPGKFLRLNSVSEKGEPIQYLLKFGNESIRDELYDKVEELKSIIQN